MAEFIKKLALLFIPVALWGAGIIAVDPFNYFNYSLIPSEKKASAKSINTLLFKTLDFMHNPNENIIIGDSRTNPLSTDFIESISGIRFKKLSTNAAKLNEMFDLFYLANSKIPIKRVVICINFNMFNKYGYQDRVAGVQKMLANPLIYIYNKDVLEAAFLVLKQLWFQEEISHTPPMSRQAFWDWCVKVKAGHWYGKYQFPDRLYTQLLAFDRFTRKKNIETAFIIVPHHMDFHHRLKAFGLSREQEKFKKIMAGLNATVYDYDFENPITRKKENYKDPIHFYHNIGDLIIREVWEKNLVIGKKL